MVRTDFVYVWPFISSLHRLGIHDQMQCHQQWVSLFREFVVQRAPYTLCSLSGTPRAVWGRIWMSSQVQFCSLNSQIFLVNLAGSGAMQRDSSQYTTTFIFAYWCDSLWMAIISYFPTHLAWGFCGMLKDLERPRYIQGWPRHCWTLRGVGKREDDLECEE